MSNSEWKHPNEIIKLHRLKQKQKQLQARLNRSTNNEQPHELENFGKPIPSSKRKNPFLKEVDNINVKKHKLEEFASEDTIFELLATREINETPNVVAPLVQEPLQQCSSNNEYVEKIATYKFIPIDWCLKTKLRLLSVTPIPGTQLTTNQEASGLTSFVRCIDLDDKTTGLDISPGSQFYHSTLFWEHPNLPWLTLFPRNSKLNSGFTVLGERERTALQRDWTNSLTSLFRLLRTLQCPYFYVCANSFTVLFRAAGIGGRVETHALLTPTTRGLRSALKKDGIEFTMPLKKSQSVNDSQNRSSGDLDESNEENQCNDDEEEEEEEKWLESLGVSSEEIKKLQCKDARKLAAEECEHDFSDLSLVLIEGFECQALFNFLINAKSTTTKIGKLAGIPPTLLSPVAFQGATLKNLNFRPSKIRMDNVDYCSMELKGTILPHVLPSLNTLFKSTSDSFSATMINTSTTLAFTKASENLILDSDKINKPSDFVFGRENVSDCGLSSDIIDQMCRVDRDAVKILERICYNKELSGYTLN